MIYQEPVLNQPLEAVAPPPSNVVPQILEQQACPQPLVQPPAVVQPPNLETATPLIQTFPPQEPPTNSNVPTTTSAIPTRKTSAPLESTRLDVEKSMEQRISVCSLKEESSRNETGELVASIT